VEAKSNERNGGLRGLWEMITNLHVGFSFLLSYFGPEPQQTLKQKVKLNAKVVFS
jgi:hypothetical protein